jgi:hypothetical protein
MSVTIRCGHGFSLQREYTRRKRASVPTKPANDAARASLRRRLRGEGGAKLGRQLRHAGRFEHVVMAAVEPVNPRPAASPVSPAAVFLVVG